MTFEKLGKGLEFFKGRALRDLADYRKRRRDNMVTCLDSYLDVRPSGPSSIWVGCPEVASTPLFQRTRALPIWLDMCLLRYRNDLKSELFTRPLVLDPKKIWEMYEVAYNTHSKCKFCREVKKRRGFGYIFGLEEKLSKAVEAIDKVLYFWTFRVPRDSPFAGTPRLRLSLSFDLTPSPRKRCGCLKNEGI